MEQSAGELSLPTAPTVEAMKSTFATPQFYVKEIGEAALGLLTSGQRGKALAVVSHAAYLFSDQDELFWLAAENVPLHRRCIQLSGPLPRLSVGTPFNANGHRLIVGSGTDLDFSQASIWKSPPISSDDAVAVTDLPERLCAVIPILDDLPAPVGFGSLISEIMFIASNQKAPRSPKTSAVILTHALPAVQEIAAACLAHDFPRILEQADALAGLGEGLTPSGDDFVGGLLFCRMILQSLYADVLNLEFPDLLGFIKNLKPSTNIISHTLLKDHAEGHAIDTLHQFVNALLTGQSLDNVRLIASKLIQIGHSTGWDLLTGVLTGMLLAFRISEPVIIYPSSQNSTG